MTRVGGEQQRCFPSFPRIGANLKVFGISVPVHADNSTNSPSQPHRAPILWHRVLPRHRGETERKVQVRDGVTINKGDRKKQTKVFISGGIGWSCRG